MKKIILGFISLLSIIIIVVFVGTARLQAPKINEPDVVHGVDSVTPFENVFVETAICVTSVFQSDDYSTIRYYSTDTVVAKIVQVEGVKVGTDDKIYSADEFMEQFPEFVLNGQDPKRENGEEISLLELQTVWRLEIQEVIDTETGLVPKQEILLEVWGLPDTEVGTGIQFRDQDIIVFALNKNTYNENYTMTQINSDYIVKNPRKNIDLSFEEVPAYSEFQKIKNIDKDNLSTSNIFGDLDKPESPK